MSEKRCQKCNLVYPLTSDSCIGNTCKKCANETDKKRKKRLRKKQAETTLVTCEKCNVVKPLLCFAKLKKFYKQKICAVCYPLFLTEQKTTWCKKEHDTNMNYRIKKSLASRLRTVMVKQNSISTMDYIGCNIQYLREWFEYNFTAEMTWDNYGSYWSIDHVIPVGKYDLTNEEEKRTCWNWSNLTPVSVAYNSSKKSSIDMKQVSDIIDKLEKFKVEGSTTKWFSSEFIINMEKATSKINSG